MLCIEERAERSTKRYAEIEKASETIQSLLEENVVLFGMQEARDSPQWSNYVNFVDSIVSGFLLKTVGCRLVNMFIGTF